MRLYNIRNGELEVVIERGKTSTITAQMRQPQPTEHPHWEQQTKHHHETQQDSPTTQKTLTQPSTHRPTIDQPAANQQASAASSSISTHSINEYDEYNDESDDYSYDESSPSRWKAWSARMLLISGGLAAVGNIPVYSSVHIGLDHNRVKNHKSYLITQDLRLPASPVDSYLGYAQDYPDFDTDSGQSRWQHYDLKTDESVERGFQKLGIAESLYKTWLKDSTAHALFKQAHEGVSVFAQYQGNEIRTFLYLNQKHEAFVIKKQESGYQLKWDKYAIETVKRRTAFTIKNSLTYDAAKTGVPRKISKEIHLALKEDINFKRDIRVGDKVAVIYEDLVYEGERIKSTHLLATEYDKGEQHFQRIRFALKDGKTRYLTPNADQALKRELFDRRPVQTRISSHFNPMRRHPIFKTLRPHTGTDYAAPYGTPIKATSDGRIHFVGRKGGYGKTVIIRHNGAIKTLYAHMSNYKKDLHAGMSVNKGDVIGYVGSTGNSTGNHVHYEYMVAGRYQDPEKITLPTAGIMTKQEQRLFRKVANALLAQMETAKRLADADLDVNRQNGG